MFVKITKANDWYTDKVGEVFHVVFDSTQYKYKVIGGEYTHNTINVSECESLNIIKTIKCIENKGFENTLTPSKEYSVIAGNKGQYTIIDDLHQISYVPKSYFIGLPDNIPKINLDLNELNLNHFGAAEARRRLDNMKCNLERKSIKDAKWIFQKHHIRKNTKEAIREIDSMIEQAINKLQSNLVIDTYEYDGETYIELWDYVEKYLKEQGYRIEYTAGIKDNNKIITISW